MIDRLKATITKESKFTELDLPLPLLSKINKLTEHLYFTAYVHNGPIPYNTWMACCCDFSIEDLSKQPRSELKSFGFSETELCLIDKALCEFLYSVIC